MIDLEVLYKTLNFIVKRRMQFVMFLLSALIGYVLLSLFLLQWKSDQIKGYHFRFHTIRYIMTKQKSSAKQENYSYISPQTDAFCYNLYTAVRSRMENKWCSSVSENGTGPQWLEFTLYYPCYILLGATTSDFHE